MREKNTEKNSEAIEPIRNSFNFRIRRIHLKWIIAWECLCLSFRGQIKCKFHDSNGVWTNVARSTKVNESPFARAICTLFENVWISLIRYFHYRHLHTPTTTTTTGNNRLSFTPRPVLYQKPFYFFTQSSTRAPIWCPRKRGKESNSVIPSAWKCNYAIWEWASHLMWWRGEHTKEHTRDHIHT